MSVLPLMSLLSCSRQIQVFDYAKAAQEQFPGVLCRERGLYVSID